MYNKNKELNPKSLDGQIDSLFEQMDQVEGNSPVYSQLADQMQKLMEMKNLKKANRPDANTMLAVGANLAGILMIIHHEHVGVITSKALGFVLKAKM